MAKVQIRITESLYDLVADMPHIQEVYFTAENKHFLNKYELMDAKSPNKGTGKFFGSLKVQQVLDREDGQRKYFKMKPVANPETLIVATLTREEILDMVPVPDNEIFIKKSASAIRKAEAAKEAEKAEKTSKAKQPA